MAKISGSFDDFFSPLAASAQAKGLRDGDLAAVRSSVKNTLITAGWATPEGTTEFLSESDRQTAIKAAEAEVARVAPGLVQQRKLTLSTGFHPTKEAISAGVSAAPTSFMDLSAVPQVSASSFRPDMGKVGDSCPRCSGAMQAVGLVNDRAALYCPKDRVVVPLPSGVSLA